MTRRLTCGFVALLLAMASPVPVLAASPASCQFSYDAMAGIWASQKNACLTACNMAGFCQLGCMAQYSALMTMEAQMYYVCLVQ